MEKLHDVQQGTKNKILKMEEEIEQLKKERSASNSIIDYKIKRHEHEKKELEKFVKKYEECFWNVKYTKNYIILFNKYKNVRYKFENNSETIEDFGEIKNNLGNLGRGTSFRVGDFWFCFPEKYDIFDLQIDYLVVDIVNDADDYICDSIEMDQFIDLVDEILSHKN